MIENIAPDVRIKIMQIVSRNNSDLARIRKLKRCKGKDLKALKEISIYLRQVEYWSYPDIGDFLLRDHTTIMWHVRGK